MMGGALQLVTEVPLSIRLLGRTPRFSVGERAFVPNVPPRCLALLAYLILNDGPVQRDEAAFALWPDTGETEARANLRRHLHVLVSALPQRDEPWILADRRTLEWNRAASFVLELEDEDSGAELYSSLEDEWIRPIRERDRSRRCDLLLAAALDARSRGDIDTSAAHAAALLRLDPWREDVIELSMELRLASGDRAGALNVYRSFAERLREEIGVEPQPSLTARYEAIVEGRGLEPAGINDTIVSVGLPVFLTSLHGREAEIEWVRDQLTRRRLITLVGTGGVGKTRLAVEAAIRDSSTFADALYFVDLSTLHDGALVSPTIASVFGLRERSSDSFADIATMFGTKRLLIVVDNCEHVIADAAVAVTRLLETLPRAYVLATSREPLRVSGEFVMPVAPLSSGSGGREGVLQSAAVQLFLDRAAAAHNGVDFAERFDAVARLCEHLDGIPLAIELAAARVGSMSLDELSNSLTERLSLLDFGSRSSAKRHSTLEATLDWSYELLDEPGRRLFRRLGTFRGAFDLDAAAAVGDVGDPTDLPRHLQALIDRSLVVANATLDSRSRYRLLQTTRAYALRKLDEANEVAECALLHATHYAATAELLRLQRAAASDVEWLHAMSLDADDFAAALENTLGSERWPELGATIAVALADEWSTLGRETVGLRWLERAVRQPIADARTLGLAYCSLAALYRRAYRFADAVRASRMAVQLFESLDESDALARALTILGNAIVSESVSSGITPAILADGRRYLERALEIADAFDLPVRTAEALFASAIVAHYEIDYVSALELFGRSRHLFSALGKEGRERDSYISCGIMSFALGDFETAERIANECYAIAEERRQAMMMSLAQELLGLVALERGATRDAFTAFRRSLINATALGLEPLIDARLLNFGLLFASIGEYTLAATMLGYARRCRMRGTLTVPPFLLDRFNRISSILDEPSERRMLANAMSHGAALPREAAAKLVLAYEPDATLS